MGICNLAIGMGAVNTLNYVHVTAAKVATPLIIEYEVWFKGPFASKNFVIPNLDTDMYLIRYYISPDATSLGEIQNEQHVNALTNEFTDERKEYTVGNGTISTIDSSVIDPEDGAFDFTDPYLKDKKVIGVFKEGYRYLKKDVEWQFDPTTGKITKIDGVAFSSGETVTVDIKYNAGNNTNLTGAGRGVGLYSGILTVPDPTKTLLAANRNNLIRCSGALAKQVITLPALSSISVDDGFYFDNSVVRSAVQVKILTQGADRINFTGFNTTNILFQEFWVSMGEHLLLRKLDDNLWEVRGDYRGVNVGTRISGRYINQANYLPEDGRLLDGDEYGRLWYYIKNILPTTHYIIDDNVVNLSYKPPRDKTGMFTVHSSQKKFRMPLTEGLTERGLNSFNNLGSDPARAYDYPGGWQDEMIAPHDHFMFTDPFTDPVGANGNPPYISQYKQYNTPDSYKLFYNNSKLPTVGKTSKGGGEEGRVKNFGVIYQTHI